MKGCLFLSCTQRARISRGSAHEDFQTFLQFKSAVTSKELKEGRNLTPFFNPSETEMPASLLY